MTHTKRKKSIFSRILHTFIAAAVGISSVVTAMPKIEADAATLSESYVCGSGTYSVWQFWGVTGNGTSAFCIEPAKHALYSGNYVSDGGTSSYLTDSQKKYMALAQYYGYPNASTSSAYFVATQAIIWEIAAGLRNLEDYQSTNQTSYFSLKNSSNSLKWIAGWYSGATTAYNVIETAIQKYGVRPSIGNEYYALESALTNYTLSYDPATNKYTRTLTDSRGQLSKFNLEGAINGNNGWSATRSGNDLKIEADANAEQSIIVKNKNALSFASTTYNKSLVTYTVSGAANSYQKLVSGCAFDPVGVQLKLTKKTGDAKVTKSFVGVDGAEIDSSKLTDDDIKSVTFQIFFVDKENNKEYPVILTTNSVGDYSFSKTNSSGAGSDIKLNYDRTSDKFLTAVIDELPAGTYSLKETACSDKYNPDSDKTFTVKNNSTKEVKAVNDHAAPDKKEIRFEKEWEVNTDMFTDDDGDLLNKNHQILNSQVFFTAAIGASKYLSAAKYVGTRKIGDETYSVYDANCIDVNGDLITSNLTDSESNASFLSISYARPGIIIKNLPDNTTYVTIREHLVSDYASVNMTSMSQVIARIDSAATSPKLSENYSSDYGNMQTNNVTAMLDKYINRFAMNIKGSGNSLRVDFNNKNSANKSMINGEKTVRLGFVKRNASGQLLTGGKFGLYTLAPNTTNIYIPVEGAKEIPADPVSSTGVTYFEGEYPIGVKYFVKEIEAPEGYMALTDKYVAINTPLGNNGVSDSSGLSTAMIAELPYSKKFSSESIMNMRLFGKITLHKVDYAENPVEGAVFNVYKGTSATGTPVEQITTDENGIAETTEYLELGTYTVQEVSTVSPYFINKDIQTVTLTSDDKSVYGGSYENENGNSEIFYWVKTDLYVYNNPVECEIVVNKVDEKKTPLSGAEFTLTYNKDFTDLEGVEHKAGDPVCVLTTDDNGYATTAPVAKEQGDEDVVVYPLYIGAEYKLVETKAPAGYKAKDSTPDIITFTYEDAQNGVLPKITKTYTKENPLQKGNIKVVKHTEGDFNVSGIEFTLSGTSTAGIAVNQTAKTNANGECFFTDIPVGTFDITENGDTVSSYYLVADGQKVTVVDAKETEVTFFNPELKGGLKVFKYGYSSDYPVKDVAFTLKGTSNSGRAVKLRAVSNAKGIALFKGVPTGTYTLSEDATTTPDYLIPIEDTTVTIDDIGIITDMKFYSNNFYIVLRDYLYHAEDLCNLKGTTASGSAYSASVGCTESNLRFVFKNIPNGTYTATMNNASVPYATIVVNNGTTEITYNDALFNSDAFNYKGVKNEEKTGEVEITKRTEGNFNIEGIEFILSGTSDSGRKIEKKIVTDRNGKATIPDIPVGKYTLSENEATVNKAYVVAEPKSITVEYNKTATATFKNEEKTGGIKIFKYGYDTNYPLASIRFTLTGTSDSGRNISMEATTNSNGIAYFLNVPIGNYTLKEDASTTPDPFIPAKDSEIRIDESDFVSSYLVLTENSDSAKTVTMPVRFATVDALGKTISFTLSGTSDAGANVSVTNSVNNDNSVVFDNIPLGKYSIAQKDTTVEYATVTVSNNRIEIIYNANLFEDFEYNGYYQIQNNEKTGDIEITKRTEGNRNVANIRFVLSGTSDSGRDLILDVITDENGRATIPDIPIGTYTLVEDGDTVPEAYIVADDQEIKVEYNKTTTATFFNEEKKGNIDVQKRTEGDLNVTGISFILTGTSLSGADVNITATTDANGKAVFENIPVGLHYTITEDGDTVPAAYLTAAPKKDVVVEYNKTTETEFFNKEKEGSVHVVKRTEGNKNVANVKFNLTGVSDSGRTINRSATTDTNGDANFTKLPIGKYTITEDGSTVHFAYLIATAQEVTVKYNETTETEFYNQEKEGSINVYKHTEGDLNITGIKFILAGTSDSGREITREAVTDENGKAEFKNIPIGRNYTITEDGNTVPYAYLTATAKTVVITYNNTEEEDFFNDEKKGDIEVVKRTEGNLNVANIRFVLSGTSDSGRTINQSATTDVNGKAYFEKIPIGTYTITEDGKTVPTGYLVAEPQDVEVIYAETTTATFFNAEKEGSINVYKHTEGDLNIEGIKFILSGTSETGRSITKNATTDENGKATFKKIPIGTYTISEDSSSVPYAYLTADEQNVEVFYAETSNVEFFNAEKEGTIELHKRTEGDLNVSNIKFTLSGTSDSGREITREAVTDENGKATFTKLPIGTYVITEDNTTTPYAYLTAEPQSVEVFYAKTSDVVFFNDEMKGTIEVHKRTEEYKNVEGIKFILTGTSDSGREITREAVTDENGKAEFTEIPIGTYTITEDEETTPYAYLTAEPKNVEVFYAETSNIEFFNDEMNGTIEVHKRTEEDKNIEGIKFILTGTSDSGREITREAVTDENGKAEFSEIPIGTYVISEDAETTPYAYLTAEPKNVEVFYAETSNIEFFNDEKTGSIEIKKHTEGDKNIEGIKFILSGTSDSGREITREAVTDKDGKATFTDIPVGTYVISEDGSTVPTGYLVAEQQSVEVFYAETSDVTFENDTTKVKFSKKSITGDDELEGAKLQVLDKDGNIIDEWTSGKEAHFIEGKLKAGETYTLHEEISPDGYIVANDIEFTVYDNGEVQTVTMKDETTKVKISKRDITTDEELPGAKLQIIDKDGNVVEEWTSTTEPYYIEGKLKAGETYTLREITAPNGYYVANDVSFKVNDDGSVTEVVMKDTPKPETPPTNVPPTGAKAAPIGILLIVPVILVAIRKRNADK